MFDNKDCKIDIALKNKEVIFYIYLFISLSWPISPYRQVLQLVNIWILPVIVESLVLLEIPVVLVLHYFIHVSNYLSTTMTYFFSIIAFPFKIFSFNYSSSTPINTLFLFYQFYFLVFFSYNCLFPRSAAHLLLLL